MAIAANKTVRMGKSGPQAPSLTLDSIRVAADALISIGKPVNQRTIREVLGSGSFTTILRCLDELEVEYRLGIQRFAATEWRGLVLDKLTLVIWQSRPTTRRPQDIAEGVFAKLQLPTVHQLFDLLKSEAAGKDGFLPDGLVVAPETFLDTRTLSARQDGATLKVNPRTGEVLDQVPVGMALATLKCWKRSKNGE